MDSIFALDPMEVSILLLWAAGIFYAGWRYFRHRSLLLLVLLVISICIPIFGICYAAVRSLQNLTAQKNEV